ncbi:hypothetical protein [Nocardia sp. NPDC052566]|uniref:hypothetical protein n=1 Tax=Nocardia sp. NPDC052566 TaxID=3364330 RepID=UPI0037C9B3F0
MSTDMAVTTADTVDSIGERAIALVREVAPDARFGAFIARQLEDHSEYVQVNRVDRQGRVLAGGWTFLVNSRSRKVVRTVGDPAHLDFKNALRRGTIC